MSCSTSRAESKSRPTFFFGQTVEVAIPKTLGLENIGLEVNRRGQLEVDDQFQTEKEHIYAVGDVIGYPSLASAAYTQGRAAGMHILGRKDGNLRTRDLPTGIYTSPEISSVGKTEKQLTEECVPYEVGNSQFKSLARAQITGTTVGMLKLLFHRETLGGPWSALLSAATPPRLFTLARPSWNPSATPWNTSSRRRSTIQQWRRPIALPHLNGYNRLF